MERFNADWCISPHQTLSDSRLSNVRHIESEFELRSFSDLAQWEEFKENALDTMQFCTGIFPFEEKYDLNSRVYDPIEFEGFTVEKVVLESRPGFFITGNLYRPKSTGGKVPMILNPHGHWENGRLEMSEVTRIPLRCANFALRGMAAFSFDMVGFGDSVQVEHSSYNGYEMDMWNENLLGLQIYNCIRALDFVESLDWVDQRRIGSTGASGGAMQTIWLTALDKRISASMPVNMVSTLFQGACVCESAPNLHIDLSNLEIAAMAAPRPMNLVGSTGDWTYDLPTAAYPWIKGIYRLYGAEEKLSEFFHEAPHNYNTAAQENAYDWFSQQFLGHGDDRGELEVDLGDVNRFRIFPDSDGNRPAAFTAEEFFHSRRDSRIKAIQQLGKTPEGLGSLKRALETVVGPPTAPLALALTKEEAVGGRIVSRMLLENEKCSIQLPICAVRDSAAPAMDKRGGKAVLVLGTAGKASVLRQLNSKGVLDKLLDRGCTVLSADLFLTGEFHKPYGLSGRDFSPPVYRFSSNSYVTTYNYTDNALRIQDLIGVYEYLSSKTDKLTVCGLGDAAYLVIAALPFMPGVRLACAETEETLDEDMYVERFFLPGFLAAGGPESCRRLSDMPVCGWDEFLEDNLC